MKRAFIISAASLLVFCLDVNAQDLRDVPEREGQEADAGGGEPSADALTGDVSAFPDTGLAGTLAVDAEDAGNVIPDPLPFQKDIYYMADKVASEIPRLPVYYKTYNMSVHPLLYSNHNHFSGLDMVGVGSTFRISDRLTGGLDAYVSSVYFGPYRPTPYVNASVNGHIDLKLHDNFYLIGLAGGAVRKGLDPKRAIDVGGSNYLGVGMHFKITENLGIGISHTWHNYNGKWTGRTGFYPVGF